jgi:hypothetical protein
MVPLTMNTHLAFSDFDHFVLFQKIAFVVVVIQTMLKAKQENEVYLEVYL